eukprot:1240055-Pyramimonas_sp.AAC.1
MDALSSRRNTTRVPLSAQISHVPVYACLSALKPNAVPVLPRWLCRSPGFGMKVEAAIEEHSLSGDPATAAQAVKSIMHVVAHELRISTRASSSRRIGRKIAWRTRCDRARRRQGTPKMKFAIRRFPRLLELVDESANLVGAGRFY